VGLAEPFASWYQLDGDLNDREPYKFILYLFLYLRLNCLIVNNSLLFYQVSKVLPAVPRASPLHRNIYTYYSESYLILYGEFAI